MEKPRKWLSQTIWEGEKRAVSWRDKLGGLLGPGYIVFHDLDAHLYRCLLCNFHQNVHDLNTLLNALCIKKKKQPTKIKHPPPFCIKNMVHIDQSFDSKGYVMRVPKGSFVGLQDEL